MLWYNTTDNTRDGVSPLTTVIDQCNVNVKNGELPLEEIAAYVERGREKYGQRLNGIDIKIDGEFVDLDYQLNAVPFHRIRRITGYLVGTLDRFNNGKRAEEAERVKHSI